MYGFNYFMIGSILTSNITNENKDLNNYINNIVVENKEKNKDSIINQTTSSNTNKRMHDDNEPINLSTKCRILERIPRIYEISNNNILIQEESLDDTVLKFKTNLKKLIRLKSFYSIFKIIENDLINTLKIYCNFSILKREYTLNIISKFESFPLSEQKIIYFINIINEIPTNDNVCISYNCNRQMFINQILSTNYYQNRNKKRLKNKLYRKAFDINLHKKLKIFTDDDILNITIYYINNTTDKMIQSLFIYGFQSLFNSFSKNMIPKLYHILIFIYTFNYEKEYYDLDWHEKMFEIVSLCYFKNKNLKYYYDMINLAYKNELVKSLNLYIAINSEYVDLKLHNLKELISEETNLKYVVYFIDLTNKIKCKLFGIKFNY
ncbi:hypothetical protein NAPIS_ORF02277 [Vairimorpha apis BRL 01]|uniref:Uncharacterized protein n=1 Tax=Vairimorpha apis BRL 01 TaxID=1037528 RepID=T0M9S3_9MICR|nr:hypothetical protein NAPIS_ORF02277 [Vairimorpha apis BRL 01]